MTIIVITFFTNFSLFSFHLSPYNKIIGCKKERMEKIPLRTRKRQAGKSLSFSSRKKSWSKSTQVNKNQTNMHSKNYYRCNLQNSPEKLFFSKDDLSCNLFFLTCSLYIFNTTHYLTVIIIIIKFSSFQAKSAQDYCIDLSQHWPCLSWYCPLLFFFRPTKFPLHLGKNNHH